MEKELKRVHAIISGKVQGVYFRVETKREADRQGVYGWVRNLPDGTVEAVIEGDADAVDRTVAWCRSGPRSARVKNVNIEDQTPRGGFSSFEVTH